MQIKVYTVRGVPGVGGVGRVSKAFRYIISIGFLGTESGLPCILVQLVGHCRAGALKLARAMTGRNSQNHGCPKSPNLTNPIYRP